MQNIFLFCHSVVGELRRSRFTLSSWKVSHLAERPGFELLPVLHSASKIVKKVTIIKLDVRPIPENVAVNFIICE